MKRNMLATLLVCISYMAYESAYSSGCSQQSCTPSEGSAPKGTEIYASYICCQPTDARQSIWFANIANCEKTPMESMPSSDCPVWPMCSCNE